MIDSLLFYQRINSREQGVPRYLLEQLLSQLRKTLSFKREWLLFHIKEILRHSPHRLCDSYNSKNYYL
jgi:hypothetical protein